MGVGLTISMSTDLDSIQKVSGITDARRALPVGPPDRSWSGAMAPLLLPPGCPMAVALWRRLWPGLRLPFGDRRGLVANKAHP
jgi:hypothetical protein